MKLKLLRVLLKRVVRFGLREVLVPIAVTSLLSCILGGDCLHPFAKYHSIHEGGSSDTEFILEL